MSPRPKKPRISSCPHRPPGCSLFKPAGIPTKSLELVPLMHDELEALRLCDGEGLSQEEAGTRMGISRGTVQRLVTAGRNKVIDVIVSGKALSVESQEQES
jgi:predicted DNA-binding protein (UPF0251 family)